MQVMKTMNSCSAIRNILLVDDDFDDHTFFHMALETVDASIKCHTAINGDDALQFLKKSSTLPDFIFLDLNMPRIDGKQFLKLFKQESRWLGIPVAVYSTTASEKEKKEIISMGASYFITKPSCITEIADQLKFLLFQNNKEETVSKASYKWA